MYNYISKWVESAISLDYFTTINYLFITILEEGRGVGDILREPAPELMGAELLKIF